MLLRCGRQNRMHVRPPAHPPGSISGTISRQICTSRQIWRSGLNVRVVVEDDRRAVATPASAVDSARSAAPRRSSAADEACSALLFPGGMLGLPEVRRGSALASAPASVPLDAEVGQDAFSAAFREDAASVPNTSPLAEASSAAPPPAVCSGMGTGAPCPTPATMLVMAKVASVRRAIFSVIICNQVKSGPIRSNQVQSGPIRVPSRAAEATHALTLIT